MSASAIARIDRWRSLAEGPRIVRFALAITLGIMIGITASWIQIFPEIQNQWGEDYRFFVGVAQRWVESGAYYLPHQLSGPYQATTAVDTMYPPIALYLFVPFLVLPAFLWWVIPLGIIGWHVVASRPMVIAWPVLALLVWIPRNESIVIWGNTGMWIGAAVALALRWGWPSVAVAMKPTFLPFMLIGINRRSWWFAAFGLLVISAPMILLWLDYITAMRNNVGEWPGLAYSIPDYLFLLIPIVAWVSRRELPHGSIATGADGPGDFGARRRTSASSGATTSGA